MAAKKRRVTWDYRVIRTMIDDVAYFAIHEVYYTPLGIPSLVSEEPIAASGLTKKDVRLNLKWMLQATRLPVLDMKYFEKKSKERAKKGTQ